MRLLDEADDLKLLRCGKPHVWSPPSPIMLMEWRAPPQRRSRRSSCARPQTAYAKAALAIAAPDVFEELAQNTGASSTLQRKVQVVPIPLPQIPNAEAATRTLPKRVSIPHVLFVIGA
jgi:hypothetical protein